MKNQEAADVLQLLYNDLINTNRGRRLCDRTTDYTRKRDALSRAIDILKNTPDKL